MLNVAKFLNDLKENVENLKITLDGIKEENEDVVEAENEGQQEVENQKENEKENEEEYAEPILNFVISSYYKGTGLEEVLKKLEEYLDSADVNENEINNI